MNREVITSVHDSRVCKGCPFVNILLLWHVDAVLSSTTNLNTRVGGGGGTSPMPARTHWYLAGLLRPFSKKLICLISSFVFYIFPAVVW